MNGFISTRPIETNNKSKVDNNNNETNKSG